ncbi:Zn-finger protein [Hyaloscypha sp. PMI_1271]|nr:Zn-finger protein [Hyaloscypha sp. PMI_1271]
MENDPLSPHDLRNEDPSERRSEPYLCSEDFSTKNFGRDVLPCSLCKNYDENASYTGRDPELTGNWYCKGCRPCSICGDSKGDFLLCDTCDGAYHLLCAGISTTPDEDEDWYCTNCLEGVIASLGRKEKPTTRGKKGRTLREHPLYHNVTCKADGLYHCPFENDPTANCTHQPQKLKCNYDKSVDAHLRLFKCNVKACKDLLGFSSTACLLRHEREAHAMHGHGDKPFVCPFQNCSRAGNGFPRRWNLRDHMKRVHKNSGRQLRKFRVTSLARSLANQQRR